MKITAIKPQEKRKNRVNIFINNDFALGVSDGLVVDFGLFAGKEITEKEIAELKEAENYQKAMEKAYRFLSFRQRSEKELSEKLSEKFASIIVQRVLKRLKEYGYLDDPKFAQSWVTERKLTRGRKALYFELIKKGVPKEIIENALSIFDKKDEIKNAESAALKKKAYLALPALERRQKITAFLARRGFSYDVIKEVLIRLNEQ